MGKSKYVLFIILLWSLLMWMPQIGPQTLATISPWDYTLMGGTRGGGKSDALLGRQIRGAEKYKDKWAGLIVRRKYKDFVELRKRINLLIADGTIPGHLVGGENQPNTLRFSNGAVVALSAIQHPDQLDDFLGLQFTEISIDEAPAIPFIAKMIDKLKGCLRSPYGIPCRMFLTGNPGGTGAKVIKKLFITPSPAGKPFKNEAGETFVFIPSSLEDNKILLEKDPNYGRKLKGITDPILRAAWLEGNWDVLIGQALDFNTKYHVVRPMPIPKGAPLYMTFDYGFGRPFSFGWWWVDGDNRGYRFAEWYGCDPEMEDTGLRLTDTEMIVGKGSIKGLIERENELMKKYKVEPGQYITRVCDPTCFNKKPDYKGGGQGPSTAEVFSRYKIYLTPGDPSRILKIRQFRERLMIPQDGSAPLMQVYNTCRKFIEIIPTLCVDEDNVEDVDTTQEDHLYDEAALFCMARPISMPKPKKQRLQADIIIDRIQNPPQEDFERYMHREQMNDPFNDNLPGGKIIEPYLNDEEEGTYERTRHDLG